MTLILGIDPAINCCGIAVVSYDLEKLDIVYASVIDSSKIKSNSAKLGNLYKELTKVILAKQPNFAVIEKIFANKNMKATISLAQAWGVCASCINNNKIGLFQYDNKSIKKSITGYGNADKASIKKTLSYEIGELDNYSHDTIDAIAIAYCHILNNR